MTTPAFYDAAPQLLLRSYGDIGFQAGSAEPWVSDILAALLRGNATRTAIEIGGFQGATSAKLLAALSTLPWPTTLTVCEIDSERAAAVRAAIAGPAAAIVSNAKVVVANSLDWIPTLPDESVDFAWLDGNHEKDHVYRELRALENKLAQGALVCGHDVFGVCDLQEVFEYFAKCANWRSMSLDLPMLGPAGGIGIVQRPR